MGRTVLDVIAGIAVGALLAFGLFGAWGMLNYVLLLVSSRLGTPSFVYCGNHEFGIYASIGARAYEVAEFGFAIILGFVAIRWGVRTATRSRPSAAIAVMLGVFLGLLPATICDASALYTC